jgi:long-chain acyl-CoA synthetase
MPSSAVPLPNTIAETGPIRHPWTKVYPRGLVWEKRYSGSAVPSLLAQSADTYPDASALYFLGSTMTYRQVASAVDRFAAGLQQLGVTKDVKVGLFLPNCPTYVIAYFAVLKVGGTVVNYNPLYSIPELEHQIRDSQTRLLVTLDLKILFEKVQELLTRGVVQQAVVASFASLLPAGKSLLFRIARGHELSRISMSPARDKLVPFAKLLRSVSAPDPVAISPENDIAVLQYTGGTTGIPKAAMLTHANLTCNVEQVADWAGPLVDGQERVMGILPLFHVFAMTVVMNFGIKRAAQLILVPRFQLAEAVQLMNRLRPTVLPGVPTLFNALMTNPEARSANLSSLKWCISGGAPLPLEVKKGFERMTGATLIEGYGLSETSPVATCNPVDGPVKSGSIGIPLPGTTVSIRSLEDPRNEVELGARGEICLAGPQVMRGYWNKPEENSASFVEVAEGRFFRTGDIGHMDDEGFTYIDDRLKDMINASGFKIYPRRIEEALYEMPAVEEAIAIGIPDAYRGEAPKVFIKLKQGQSATRDEVLAHLKARLAKIEMPEEVEFRDSLPKTAVGKLSKKELKAEELAKRGQQR